MRRGSRLLRVAKWAGVGACSLLLAIWSASLWYGILLPLNSRSCLEIEDGRVILSIYDFATWHTRRDVEIRPCVSEKLGLHGKGLQIRKQNYATAPSGPLEICVRFWLLFPCLAIPTAALSYAHSRRPKPGHCKTCGYNLTGNTSGVCSECGARIIGPVEVAVADDTVGKPT